MYMSKKIDEKMNGDIIMSLEALGLKKKEARVYLALLELGQVGSSKIIQRTGLHGQFVYQALEGLEEKGLAQHAIQAGRKKLDRKSTRLNSSHSQISYAVFCLKK